MSLRRRTLTTTVAAVSAALAVAASATHPPRRSPHPSSHRKLDSSSAGAVPDRRTRRHRLVDRRLPRARSPGSRTARRRSSSPGGAEGVAVSGKKLAFTTTPENSFSRLVVRRPGKREDGREPPSLRAHPQPRRNVHYGIIRNYSQCAADFFNSQQPGSARYTGIVDSHPYQVEALPDGAWAVAEAAGNEILRVSKRGRISVSPCSRVSPSPSPSRWSTRWTRPTASWASGTPSSPCRPTSSVTGTATCGSRCFPAVRRTRASVPAVRSTRSTSAAGVRGSRAASSGATNLAVTGRQGLRRRAVREPDLHLRNGKIVTVRSIDRARWRSRRPSTSCSSDSSPSSARRVRRPARAASTASRADAHHDRPRRRRSGSRAWASARASAVVCEPASSSSTYAGRDTASPMRSCGIVTTSRTSSGTVQPPERSRSRPTPNGPDAGDQVAARLGEARERRRAGRRPRAQPDQGQDQRERGRARPDQHRPQQAPRAARAIRPR